MATASTDLTLVNALQEGRARFLEVTNGDLNSFLRESEFAMQQLRRNSFVAGIARNNPMSLRDAIIQGASMGISLNPVLCHGYLVPRDGAVILDVGYRGLRDTAVSDEIVSWVRAEIVYEDDEFSVFTNNETGDRIVLHKFDPLDAKRTKIRGGYCEWGTPDGRRDAIFETLDDLYKSHRSRSEAWRKSQSGIWKTDEPEAIRKSLIKRAHKSWPRIAGMGKRFDAALAAAITADGDAVLEQQEQRATADVLAALTAKAEKAETPIAKWCDFYKVADLAELTPEQADDMGKRLDANLKKKGMDAAKEAAKASPADAKAEPKPEAKPTAAPKTAAKKPEQPALKLTGDATDEESARDLGIEIDDYLDRLSDGDGGIKVQYETEARKSAGLAETGELDLAGLTALRDELVKAIEEMA